MLKKIENISNIPEKKQSPAERKKKDIDRLTKKRTEERTKSQSDAEEKSSIEKRTWTRQKAQKVMISK
jgi:hypothetical protein